MKMTEGDEPAAQRGSEAGGLCLYLKLGETVTIGDARVSVFGTAKSRIRIRIVAPRDVRVTRDGWVSKKMKGTEE